MGWWEALARRLGFGRPRPTTVKAAKEGGFVKLQGVARGSGRAVLSPIAGDRCAAFRLRVERGPDDAGRAGGDWTPLLTSESQDEFFVEDATGRARIVAAKAEIDSGARWTYSRTRPLPASLAELLVRQGHGVSRPLRWREDRLGDGDAIVVIGVARWRHAPGQGSAGYREVGRELVIDAPAIDWIEVRSIRS